MDLTNRNLAVARHRSARPLEVRWQELNEAGAAATLGPDLHTKMGGACTKQAHVAPGPLAEARIDRPAVPVAEAAGTSISAQQAGEAKGTAGDDGTSISAQQAGEAKGTAGDDGTSISAQQAGELIAEQVTAPVNIRDTDPTDLVQHGSRNGKNCVRRATRQ